VHNIHLTASTNFSTAMPPKNKYTDPKLRDEVKNEIQESDKGGAPGQWSARKAQMMAKEYKKRGGDYNTPKSDQDESQKHLSKWGEEEWQTKEGSAEAKQSDGTRKRYLPKKAWEEMNEKEKEETEQKKQEGGQEGKQFVGNTPRAKKARENANKEVDEKYEQNKDEEQAATRRSTRAKKEQTQGKVEKKKEPAVKKGRSRGKKQEAEHKEVDEDETELVQQDDKPAAKKGLKRSRKPDAEEEKEDTTPQKKQKASSGSARSRKQDSGEQNSSTPAKKQKSSRPTKKNDAIGSKHEASEPPAQQASKSRLPKKGQKAYWKSLPGWIDGEVVEVVKTEKEVDGKKVKGSKDDPRIVLKSRSSGKIAVHKVDAVYFD